MTQEKQNDAIEYSLNDMRANVRTHIPDFELASKIMSELERAQRMRETLEMIVGHEGNQHTTRMAKQALSDAPKEGE